MSEQIKKWCCAIENYEDNLDFGSIKTLGMIKKEAARLQEQFESLWKVKLELEEDIKALKARESMLLEQNDIYVGERNRSMEREKEQLEEAKKRGWALWELRELVEDLNETDLRALFAIIGGKLGKREITPEQQATMQADRKRKVI